MEILIFALIATSNGYTQHETIVSEPTKPQPFDLRPLRHSYSAEGNSPRRPSVRKKWVVVEATSQQAPSRRAAFYSSPRRSSA